MKKSIPLDSYMIIIGAMKSGTSSLFKILSEHPSISSSKVKEPEYFSVNQNHGIEVENYEDLFSFNPLVHVKCLEASTGYTKFPTEIDVAKRMKEYGIDPIFIYTVRNPIKRIESQYNYTCRNASPENKIEREMLNFEAINISMYYNQLREYLKVYPDKDKYFIADFDDLKSNPNSLANRIFMWAGLEPYDIKNKKPRNVTPKPTKIEEILDSYSIDWDNVMPRKVRARLRGIIQKFDVTATEEVSKKEEEKLMKWLKYDALRLKREFNFPVEKWGF